LDVVAPEVADDLADDRRVLVDDREVGHHLDLLAPLQALDDVERAVLRRAARAVGHREEVGVQLLELLQLAEQALHPLLGLRRKELDRERESVAGVDVNELRQNGFLC
jgi:hypothetical protein